MIKHKWMGAVTAWLMAAAVMATGLVYLYPSLAAPVAGSAGPAYAADYHAYLQQLVDGYFNSGVFARTIASLDALISPYAAKDPSAFYDNAQYQTAVRELTKLGLLRAESIEGQLNGTIPAAREGQSADGSRLADASGINLSALGSMGGGMGAGFMFVVLFKRKKCDGALRAQSILTRRADSGNIRYSLRMGAISSDCAASCFPAKHKKSVRNLFYALLPCCGKIRWLTRLSAQ